jgi:hypothetical protein
VLRNRAPGKNAAEPRDTGVPHRRQPIGGSLGLPGFPVMWQMHHDLKCQRLQITGEPFSRRGSTQRGRRCSHLLLRFS